MACIVCNGMACIVCTGCGARTIVGIATVRTGGGTVLTGGGCWMCTGAYVGKGSNSTGSGGGGAGAGLTARFFAGAFFGLVNKKPASTMPATTRAASRTAAHTGRDEGATVVVVVVVGVVGMVTAASVELVVVVGRWHRDVFAWSGVPPYRDKVFET
jgi:hypothetical protein